MQQKILVTGGGGFLGSRLCALLVARGYRVRSISRGSYPELEKLGVESLRCDLSNREAVIAAASCMDAIVHTAAKAGYWGRPSEFYRTNVEGTRNIVEAARLQKISRLVYTSSPSVVFAGKELRGEDESLPIPKRHYAAYPASKAQGEQLVLAAHNGQSLCTTALRPHFIWGPGDNHILPQLVERARQGRLVMIGDGQAQVDVTYVDNAAWAHIQALEALGPGARLGGKAYFIGQEAPIGLWDFIRRLLASQGITVGKVAKIPYPLAYGLGGLCEAFYTIFRIDDKPPPLTRLLAFSLARSHYFSHQAAYRDFGYRPILTLDQAFKRMELVSDI